MGSDAFSTGWDVSHTHQLKHARIPFFGKSDRGPTSLLRLVVRKRRHNSCRQFVERDIMTHLLLMDCQGIACIAPRLEIAQRKSIFTKLTVQPLTQQTKYITHSYDHSFAPTGCATSFISAIIGMSVSLFPSSSCLLKTRPIPCGRHA